MELYIYKIPNEDSYVKVNQKTLGFRRTKNINDASWWMSKGIAKSWSNSITAKFPQAIIIPVDMSLTEVKFNKLK